MKNLLARFGADVLIGGLLALVVTGAAFALSYPYVHPSAWGDYAVGTGLRPAGGALPFLWTLLARGLTDFVGAVRAAAALPMIGRILLGGIAWIVYGSLVAQLGYMSPLSQRPVRQRMLLRVVSAAATIAFVTSDAVWTAAQSFTPGFLTFVFLLVALCSFQSFYFYGGRLAAVICATALTLSCIETPLALVLGLGMAYLVKRRWVANHDGDAFRKWVTDIRWPAFVLAVTVAVLVARAGIVLYHDDWKAAGEVPDMMQMVSATVVFWLEGVGRAARFDGWLVLLVLTVGPLIGLMAVFRKACDEEAQFPFLGLVCHIIYCVFGFFQFVGFGHVSVFAFFPSRMFPGELVRLPALLIFAFCLAMAASVLVTEAFTRRVVWHHDKVSDAILGIVQSASERFRLPWRRVATVLLTLFLLSLLVMPFVDDRRESLVALRDFVSAVVDDAKDCTDICTDGRLDDAYRMEAARRGATLRPRPMLTRGSKVQGLMQRIGIENAELKLAAGEGPAACLRAMIKDHPQLLDRLAVQIGFEVWRMELRPLPPMWGTLARFSGTPEERKRSIAAARALGARFIVPSSAFVRTDEPLAEIVDCARWRLSRMAKCRAEEADRADNVKTSARERELMRSLDAANETLNDLLADLARTKRNRGRALSPREVLHLALMRGDCSACGTLAAAVLETDPENGEAHFAMALSCAADDDYKGAESHFRFCMKLRPNDPVIRNNLALTLHNLGRFTEAREQAQRALEIAPHVDEIRDTLARIREAEAIAATNGVPLKIRLAIMSETAK